MNPQELATREGRSVTLPRVAIVAVSVVPTLVYLSVGLRRIGYPFELEWLEGGAVEIVRRVAHGRSMYVAPSIHYVPYPYTPLYFWISGALAHVTGVSFLPLRLVSLLSSLGAAWMIVRIVWRETGDAVAGIVASGLFTATFAVSGAWFDIGRVDSLALLLLLLALSAARRATSGGAGAGVGLFIFVAFMAKQSALLAAGPVVVLLIVTHRRAGLAALGTVAGLLASSTVLLNALTHGWYGYYVFQELTHQGTESAVWVTFFTVDLRHLAWAIGVGLVGLVVHLRHRTAPTTNWRFWMVATGGLVLSGFVSRLHSGGGADVLMPAFAAVALLGGLGYDSLRRGTTAAPGRVGAALAIVVTVQLVVLRYSPQRLVPTAADETAGTVFIALVRDTPGPVIVTDHPHYATMAGKAPWAQGEAVHDVLRAGPSRARTALVASIDAFARSSRPVTIFSDLPDVALEGSPMGSFELTPPRVFTCDACFYPVTDLRRRPDYRFQR